MKSPKLFQSRLDQILNMKHPLAILAKQIDWEFFEKEFDKYYSDKRGTPGKPIRLIVGLHHLKHAFNESDENVVERFIENPYWQYSCGYEYFWHKPSIRDNMIFQLIPAVCPACLAERQVGGVELEKKG